MHRRSPLPALIFAVLVLLATGCDGGGDASPRPSLRPAVIKANFTSLASVGIDPNDRPEAAAKAAGDAGAVIALLNSYYDLAFLDRAKWAKGTHPELPGLFVPEAHSTLGPNLGALALADLAVRFRTVRPITQEATKISLFVEDDMSTPQGVVNVLFRGIGTPVSRRATPVEISHSAVFWVQREGDTFKISAYTAELKADTAVRSGRSGVTDTSKPSP